MKPEAFYQALINKGILLNQSQKEQFQIYYQTLIDWNQKINLTAITQEEEVYLKHFYDSLLPLWLANIPENASLVDVGAGAGFPSIPLKIVRPDLKITIIDSLNKRIQFLDSLVATLGLENVRNVHLRAEEAGQLPLYRQSFELATARAVAALNILCELCLPLVKKGGHFIALKGQGANQEISEASKAIQVLGAKLIASPSEQLPLEESSRTIVIIQKTLETPKKYPRRAGKPNKEPIS